MLTNRYKGIAIQFHCCLNICRVQHLFNLCSNKEAKVRSELKKVYCILSQGVSVDNGCSQSLTQNRNQFKKGPFYENLSFNHPHIHEVVESRSRTVIIQVGKRPKYCCVKERQKERNLFHMEFKMKFHSNYFYKNP